MFRSMSYSSALQFLQGGGGALGVMGWGVRAQASGCSDGALGLSAFMV